MSEQVLTITSKDIWRGSGASSYSETTNAESLAAIQVEPVQGTVTKRQNLRSSVHIDFLFNSCTDVLRPIVSRVCDGSSQNQSHLLSVCHSERKASKGLSAA